MALIKGREDIAFALFFLAGLTDLLDGLLARYWQAQTKIGSILDPLADKFLAASSFIILGYYGYLPLFLIVLVIAREIGIFIGLVLYKTFVGKIKFVPSFLSKVNTVFQILLIGTTLFNKAVIALPGIIVTLLIIIVTVTTVASFLVYVYQGFSDRDKRLQERLIHQKVKS